MNIKKRIPVTLLLFTGSIGFMSAQEAATAAGADASGSGGSVNYSIGQVAYADVTNSNGSVYQGVQQPYTFITTGISNREDINLEMSVYPNPTAASVKLKVSAKADDNVSYELFDISGKKLLGKQITGSENTIPMENFPSAVYILKVSQNNKEVKTFKINKNN